MKYRKKPVVIEAMQWVGDNVDQLLAFVHESDRKISYNHKTNQIIINTLEGNMATNINGWIIKGVQGEFYPCKPDIFEQTYEKVEKDANRKKIEVQERETYERLKAKFERK